MTYERLIALTLMGMTAGCVSTKPQPAVITSVPTLDKLMSDMRDYVHARYEFEDAEVEREELAHSLNQHHIGDALEQFEEGKISGELEAYMRMHGLILRKSDDASFSIECYEHRDKRVDLRLWEKSHRLNVRVLKNPLIKSYADYKDGERIIGKVYAPEDIEYNEDNGRAYARELVEAAEAVKDTRVSDSASRRDMQQVIYIIGFLRAQCVRNYESQDKEGSITSFEAIVREDRMLQMSARSMAYVDCTARSSLFRELYIAEAGLFDRLTRLAYGSEPKLVIADAMAQSLKQDFDLEDPERQSLNHFLGALQAEMKRKGKFKNADFTRARRTGRTRDFVNQLPNMTNDELRFIGLKLGYDRFVHEVFRDGKEFSDFISELEQEVQRLQTRRR